jgi:hypothetical protein
MDSKKRKIIVGLFVAAIAVLIANLALSIVWKENFPAAEKKREINPLVIENKFKESLVNLGFENEWIKKKKQSKINLLSYNVSVPADLPITVILDEVFTSFKNFDVNVKSEEQKINGRTALKISGKDNFKLTAEFHYDKSLSRNAGKVGIYISGINNLSNDEVIKLLSIPETFELLLIPSKSSGEILKILAVHKKGYGILLSDEINELEYKLNESYSNGRLKSSIRSIIGKFYNASAFIIDNKSDLFSSHVYSLLKEEFDKRKIKLIPENDFADLTNESSNTALIDFRTQVEKTKRGEKSEFVMTADEFELLQPEIIKFRRVGYKFFMPSELIKE